MEEKFIPVKNLSELVCFDCKKVVKEDEDFMPYYHEKGDCLLEKEGVKKTVFIKCRACHTKEPTLYFQECEVFSRIVGYIRPVSQWNPGKVEEYKDRVNFSADLALGKK